MSWARKFKKKAAEKRRKIVKWERKHLGVLGKEVRVSKSLRKMLVGAVLVSTMYSSGCAVPCYNVRLEDNTGEMRTYYIENSKYLPMMEVKRYGNRDGSRSLYTYEYRATVMDSIITDFINRSDGEFRGDTIYATVYNGESEVYKTMFVREGNLWIRENDLPASPTKKRIKRVPTRFSLHIRGDMGTDVEVPLRIPVGGMDPGHMAIRYGTIKATRMIYELSEVIPEDTLYVIIFDKEENKKIFEVPIIKSALVDSVNSSIKSAQETGRTNDGQ